MQMGRGTMERWYIVYTICYKKPPTSHLYAYKDGTVVRYKKRTITYTYRHIHIINVNIAFLYRLYTYLNNYIYRCRKLFMKYYQLYTTYVEFYSKYI